MAEPTKPEASKFKGVKSSFWNSTPTPIEPVPTQSLGQPGATPLQPVGVNRFTGTGNTYQGNTPVGIGTRPSMRGTGAGGLASIYQIYQTIQDRLGRGDDVVGTHSGIQAKNFMRDKISGLPLWNMNPDKDVMWDSAVQPAHGFAPKDVARNTNWEGPAETPPPPVATEKKADDAPKVDPPKAMQAPLYDPYAENAMNRRVTEASDLSAQGRSTRSALASRLGNLDVSGSSAPFLAPGVINAQLGLEDENAGSFDKQATNVLGAMPSILGGIKEGFTSPQLFEAQKIKSMFEQADPKTQAEIANLTAQAGLHNVQAKGYPAHLTNEFVKATQSAKEHKNPAVSTLMKVYESTQDPASRNEIAKNIAKLTGGEILIPALQIQP